MSRYPNWTREEADKTAGAIADMLDSMGFTAMATDCRGKRLQGDLPTYARIALKNLRRDNPQFAERAAVMLRNLGLVRG